MVTRHAEQQSNELSLVRKELDGLERVRFSGLACFSEMAVRRTGESATGHRQPFAQDADRILHSRAYSRTSTRPRSSPWWTTITSPTGCCMFRSSRASPGPSAASSGSTKT